MKNIGAVIGLVIIVGALGFSAVAFKNNLVNAVPFTDAIKATDSDVQIMGKPVVGTMAYDSTAHALRFALQNETGQQLSVIYKGPKPDDLDTAMTKAVAINAQGTYDLATKTFVADNLLVKCPSKYQSQGTTDRRYGS